MNAVTSLTWVRRGVAKSRPDTVRLTDEELSALIESSANRKPDAASDSEDEADTEIENQQVGAVNTRQTDDDVDPVEAKYQLEDYEDDDEDEDGALSMAALSFYTSNQQDPYLKKHQLDDSDDEDLTVNPDDNLIVIGKVRGDYCTLEVWVNNSADGSFYCHHDAVLSGCPLAMEWVGYDPGERGSTSANMVAIGSMSPDIEIWDLDVVNTLEPAFTLKGDKRKKKKVHKAKKVKHSPGHTDAVLGLSWNHSRPQVLASASADESVGIWDLSHGTAVSFFRQHNDKVQAVQWHPVEDQLLLTGSYDGTVRLFDCRSPGKDASRKWSLGGEIEKVLWNHHNPFYLFAGTDTGQLACLDVRSSSAVYSYQAHTAAVTALALSPTIANCLVTASDDHLLKVWDVGTDREPSLVSERNCKIGAIHCGGACPDESLLFCVGGDREMKVISLKRDTKVTEHFVSGPTDAMDDTDVSADASGRTDSSSVSSPQNAPSGSQPAASRLHKLKKTSRIKNKHLKLKKR